jgi:hypothetical protein
VDVNLNSNRIDDYQSCKHNKTMIIKMDETNTKMTSILSIHKKTSPKCKGKFVRYRRWKGSLLKEGMGKMVEGFWCTLWSINITTSREGNNVMFTTQVSTCL